MTFRPPLARIASRLVRAVLVLSVIAIAGGCGGNAGSPKPTADTSGSVVVSLACDQFLAGNGNQISRTAIAAVGGILTVTLCDFGSDGGYTWADPEYDPSALAPIDHVSAAPSSGLAGASGSSTWRFRVSANTSSTVIFTDRRVWEGDNPLVVVLIGIDMPSASPTLVASASATGPDAPTGVIATAQPELVACPNAGDGAGGCQIIDLAWHSNEAAATWFRVYEDWIEGGSGLSDCPATPGSPYLSGSGRIVLETAPAARSAEIVMATPVGGLECLSLSAVNNDGESLAVPAVMTRTP